MLTIKRVNKIINFLIQNNYFRNTNIFNDEIVIKEDENTIIIEEIAPCDKDSCVFDYEHEKHVIATTTITKKSSYEYFYQMIFYIYDGDYFEFLTRRQVLKMEKILKQKDKKKVSKI